MSKVTIIENYIKLIKKEAYNLAPASSMALLRSELYDFWDSNPNCTFEDLTHRFGTPKDVAKELVECTAKLSAKEVTSSQRRRSIIISILAIITIILIIIAILYTPKPTPIIWLADQYEEPVNPTVSELLKSMLGK